MLMKKIVFLIFAASVFFPCRMSSQTMDHAVEAYHNYAGDEDMIESLPITDIEKHEDGSVSFKFMGGEGESITTLKADQDAAPVYRMDGRFVGNDPHRLSSGLYIVNGRIELIR